MATFETRSLRSLLAWKRNAAGFFLPLCVSLIVSFVFPFFFVLLEKCYPWVENWTMISTARAYKVTRVCEEIVSKHGKKEKCTTKLLKEAGGKPPKQDKSKASNGDKKGAPASSGGKH